MIQVTTLVRLVLPLIFALLLWLAPTSTTVLFACLGLLIALETVNFMDSRLSGSWEQASRFSAMMEPFSESWSRILIFWAMAGADLALPLVPLVLALSDVTMAYARITLTRCGKTVSTHLSERIKILTQAAGGVALLLGPLYWQQLGGKDPGAVVSWLVMVVTAASVVRVAVVAIRSALAARSK
jgi:phosphatidylglycerophosphate synthase